MEWLPESRKAVNTFVNTSILDAHTFNIIYNPADIDNIIERVRPAINSWQYKMETGGLYYPLCQEWL